MISILKHGCILAVSLLEGEDYTAFSFQSNYLLGEVGVKVGTGLALAKLSPAAASTSTRHLATAIAKSQLLPWLHGLAF